MTESVRHGLSRRDRLASWVTPRIVVEGFGLVGVVAGLWTAASALGVAGALGVALVLYTLSGVYAFGAGQFVLAATMPARLTPELALVEFGLALVLVGETVTRREVGISLLGAATLVLVAVGVGIGVTAGLGTVEVRETDVAFLAGGGFALLSGALWLFARSISAEAVTAVADRDGLEGER